jgi:uncharacterized membrane protein
MKTLFQGLATMCLAGFLFLLPVYVAFQIASRAWATLGSLAARIARVVGAGHVLGVQAETVFTLLLLLVLCILCGWLVRFSLVSAFHDAVERQLARYVPGYEGYRAAAEAKLRNAVKVLPPTSALIMYAGFWRPGYLIEQDDLGNSVVFLPDTPNTDQGQVLLASNQQIRAVPSLAANQLDSSLKKLGKGLLSEHRVVPHT